jgi:hypothetical protein
MALTVRFLATVGDVLAVEVELAHCHVNDFTIRRQVPPMRTTAVVTPNHPKFRVD